MVICIPKKPFSITSKILLHIVRLSWIPISIFIIHLSNIQNKPDDLLLLLPFCFVQIFFTFIWIYEINEKKHYVKWCDEKPNDEAVN